jgi:DnaJ-class molecular chaperone
VNVVCHDCDGDGEAPRSLLGACLICPTCGGHGELTPAGDMVGPDLSQLLIPFLGGF